MGYPVLDISSIKNTASDIQMRQNSDISEMKDKAMNMQNLYNLELSQISQATSNPNFVGVTQPKNMSFGGNQKGNQKNMQQIRIQKQQSQKTKHSFDSRKTSRNARPPNNDDQFSEMESSQPTELMAASDDLNEFISQKKRSQHKR